MIFVLFYMRGSEPAFSMPIKLPPDELNEFWIVMRTGTAVMQCDQSSPFANEINQ